MNPFGNPSLGLGEYLALWLIILAGVFAIGGVLFGTPIGGAILFFIAVAVAVILLYAILARLFMFLLHGQIRGEKKDDTGSGSDSQGSRGGRR